MTALPGISVSVRTLVATAAVSLLTACTAVQQAADDAARGRAKRAVNGVVAQQFPGVDATPVTDCIIDAASAQEILQIAASSATGASADVAELTLQIARRPEAISCYLRQGIVLAAS